MKPNNQQNSAGTNISIRSRPRGIIAKIRHALKRNCDHEWQYAASNYSLDDPHWICQKCGEIAWHDKPAGIHLDAFGKVREIVPEPEEQ